MDSVKQVLVYVSVSHPPQLSEQVSSEVHADHSLQHPPGDPLVVGTFTVVSSTGPDVGTFAVVPSTGPNVGTFAVVTSVGSGVDAFGVTASSGVVVVDVVVVVVVVGVVVDVVVEVVEVVVDVVEVVVVISHVGRLTTAGSITVTPVRDILIMLSYQHNIKQIVQMGPTLQYLDML